MHRWPVRLLLLALCWLVLPQTSFAPLIYRPGEGWVYEPVGGDGKWQRTRAKDQLEVAQDAFVKNDYSLTLKAARRTVKVWPLSDYAPQAQYLVGRCYEARGSDEKAFKEYQNLLEKYPKIENYQEILKRQFDIANRYLDGKWFRVFGYLPLFPSMDKTVQMYEKIIKNGHYSEVAPQAQMNIGAARERQSRLFNDQEPYIEAVKAYEKAADRYHDQPKVAANALFRAGLAYKKQAKTAEYDQNASAQAIASFTDFMTLYPNDARVPEAQRYIEEMKAEQSRGSFEIARFYERRRRWEAAQIYYNEVLNKDPNSRLAGEARKRIEELKRRVSQKPAPKTAHN